MNIKQKNLSILEKQYPSFFAFLTASKEEECTLEIIPTVSGYPTLSVNSTLVHSSRDPNREAERLAQTFNDKKPLILFGFGLGYLAEALYKKKPDRCIIIVERHTAILRAALENRDLSLLLREGRLIFLVGGSGQAILQSLNLLDECPVLVRNRSLVEQDQSWYDDIETSIENWKNQKDINEATRKRFASRWVKNLVLNIEKLPHTPGIAILKNIAVEIPVLVLAGGPSLDTVLPCLPQLADRCILVAVDTAVRAVLGSGVHPDFIVSVDPQYWNSRHLDYCSSPKSCLISEAAVYPSVLRLAFRQCFFYKSNFTLGSFLEDRVGVSGSLGAGGSVACAAWDFARFIGADSIWTAGLDLSYPDLRTHFKGALFEEWSHFTSKRFSPAETSMFKMLVSGQNKKAAALSGKPVLSDRRMLLYASWFERQFKTDPDHAPRSLGNQGLAINGMITCTIQDILTLPLRRTEINACLSSLLKNIKQNYNTDTETIKRKKALKAAIQELVEMLDVLMNDCKEALTEIVTGSQALSNPDTLNIRPVLLALERINTDINRNKAKDIASFLFPAVEDLKKRLSGTTTSKEKEHLDFSELLYKEIIENSSFILGLLKTYAKEYT